jgi:(2Fe-2S) ferredoxin
MTRRLRVGVVGGTGYAGAELLRILAEHPFVDIVSITSRADAGVRVDTLFPNLRNRIGAVFLAPEEAGLERCDVVLLFWSDRAAQDEEVCSQVNRAMGAGKRFTMVNLDDSPAPGLPPGTPEHSAKIRFLAGHQWYAWVKQFSREVARAIAASHLRNGNARQDTVTSELLPSSHTRH